MALNVVSALMTIVSTSQIPLAGGDIVYTTQAYYKSG
jgi:hypothetical protein